MPLLRPAVGPRERPLSPAAFPGSVAPARHACCPTLAVLEPVPGRRATFPEKCSTTLHRDIARDTGAAWGTPPAACNIPRKVLHDVARGGAARVGTPTKRNATPPASRQRAAQHFRSEEHTSELQSLMRISSAVFCLKKNKDTKQKHTNDKVIQS